MKPGEINNELAALKAHLEHRGLEKCDCIELFTVWLGAQCGIHSRTQNEARHKAQRLGDWIEENAVSVSESLRGGGRVN